MFLISHSASLGHAPGCCEHICVLISYPVLLILLIQLFEKLFAEIECDLLIRMCSTLNAISYHIIIS